MDHGAISYRRYLDGDDSGIVEIVQLYKDDLMLFLNRYVHDLNAAEELTEETLFKLVVKKPRFQPDYSFKTWLYTIGRNLAINYLRRGRRLSSLDEPAADDSAAFERSVIEQEQKIELLRIMEQLNPLYGEVLHLAYFASLTNEEIARVMKKNTRQIQNLLYRAKNALREELLKEGFEYEDVH